jgi:predicted peptidase
VFGTHVWALDANQSRYPAFVLAPQTDRGWNADQLELVFNLTQSLIRELPIDPTRIYVTGQSMGGIGTWDLLAAHPRFFAAGIIVCGGGDPRQALAARDTPTWIFHGALDTTIPVQNARQIEQALIKSGSRPKYTEYPRVGHNVWEWAYLEPSLIEWLFTQQVARHP